MSSNVGRRIDRLLPTLSAQERAVLVLRQYKAGNSETPELFGSMPSQQVAAFNRYIRLMNTVNSDLGAALLLLDAQVTQTDIKYAWLMSLLMFGDDIEGVLYPMLRELKEPKLRREIKRLVASMPGALKRPIELNAGDKESVTVRLVRGLVAGIADGLGSHWRELRAIELVVEEVAEEFGGEDPLRADTRKLLDHAKAACVKLSNDVRPYLDGFELPEPADDDVELVRRFVMSQVDER